MFLSLSFASYDALFIDCIQYMSIHTRLAFGIFFVCFSYAILRSYTHNIKSVRIRFIIEYMQYAYILIKEETFTTVNWIKLIFLEMFTKENRSIHPFLFFVHCVSSFSSSLSLSLWICIWFVMLIIFFFVV